MNRKYALNDTGIELQERVVHTTLHKQQHDVLIKAVDSYLDWRAHHRHTEPHGYPSGYFTWLRHFTHFGKNRAEDLKNKLSEGQTSIIVLLQKHFKKHSTINNHSLDTYILEGIFNKKTLFLHWFPHDGTLTHLNKLDASQRAVLRTAIIASISTTEYGDQYFASAKKYDEGDGVALNKAEALSLYAKASDYGNSSAALLLAQHHQIAQDALSEEKTATAFHYYLEAAKLGHPDALPSLERLAEEMRADKQMALSQLYASFFNNPEKANYWCSKAKEVETFDFNR